jgi:hypothetical protein
MPTREVSVSELSDDTPIWHYIKFPYFISMLQTCNMFFARPFTFDDRWEGVYPPPFVRRIQRHAIENGLPFTDHANEFMRRRLTNLYGTFVKCWHIGKHECDAMWRLYAFSTDGGVAIKTTVGDVEECLRPDHSGAVEYYDPGEDLKSKGLLGPKSILFKRESFRWEREFRIWNDDPDSALSQRIGKNEPIDESALTNGREVGITDMGALIHKVVVPPGASDSFLELVRSECRAKGKGSLADKVERSYSDRHWGTFWS